MFVKSFKHKYVYLAVSVVNILCFLSGAFVTWSSPVLIKLSKNNTDNPLGRPVTLEERSWIGSLSSIGGVLGSVLFGLVIDRIGRKLSSIFITIPFTLAYLIAAFGEHVYFYYLSRLIAGFATGGAFCVTPMYVGEVAPKEIRGALGTSTAVFIMAGCLFSYSMGAYTSIRTFNLISCVLPIICLVCLLFLVPETPYYLLQKNRREEAFKSLQRLRGTTEVQSEFQDIENFLSKFHKGSIVDIFKSKATIKAFVITIVLVNLQEFSGILVFLTYTESIFERIGAHFSPAMSSILAGTAQFCIVLTSPLYVDRFGRKTLLLFSTTGLIITLATIGTFFYIRTQDTAPDNLDNISLIPLIAFIGFFVFYNSGVGNLPRVVLAEVFPQEFKAAGTSVTNGIFWSVSFLLNYYFESMVEIFGMGVTFWIFAGFCCAGWMFIKYFVIETKGKSFQEIQELLCV